MCACTSCASALLSLRIRSTRHWALRFIVHPCMGRLRIRFPSLTSVLKPESPETSEVPDDVSVTGTELELDPPWLPKLYLRRRGELTSVLYPSAAHNGVPRGGFGWDPPPPRVPLQSPPKAWPEILKLKPSWRQRRRSKILAVSLKHWKGRRGGGKEGLWGGGAPPTVYSRSNTSLAGGRPGVLRSAVPTRLGHVWPGRHYRQARYILCATFLEDTRASQRPRLPFFFSLLTSRK